MIDRPARVPLRIAAAQPATVACDVRANALAHAAAVDCAQARVVIFPELSLTGYEFDAPGVNPGDAPLSPLVEACRANGALALAGAPVSAADGMGRTIGILAIDGDGAHVAYRKMWLGSAESGCFAPGSQPAVVEVDGWRIGLAVCRDTGIPEHAALTAALGIDLYAAGVLETAEDAHVPDERARRIAAAHGVWVAIASFAGSTGEGYDHAAGGSGIWAPDGSILDRIGPEVGAIAVATIGG